MPRITATIILLMLVASGCINIKTRTQPEDSSVKALFEGRDCVSIMFGFGFGTATIERARIAGVPIGQLLGYDVQGVPISKIRRVEIEDAMALMFGDRCVVVTGE